MEYEYAISACNLQKNHLSRMTQNLWQRPYLISLIRAIIHCSSTVTKASIDGLTSYNRTDESGVVVGCLRKLQGWSYASIFNEYDRYAQGKGESDLQADAPKVILTLVY